MSNFNVYNALKELYIFILGFLGFSILGQYFIFEVLKLPFFLLEIYFIPLLYYKRNNIYNTLNRMCRVNFSYAMIYLLLIASMVIAFVTTFEFKVLFDYRSIIYLLFAFRYIKKYEHELSIQLLLKISLYAMLGELVYILGFSNSRIVSSTNCIVIALSIVASFILGRYILVLLCLVIGVLIGICSGFRIGIAVAVITFLIMCFYFVFSKTKYRSSSNRIKRITFMLISTVILVIFFSNFESIVYRIAELVHLDYFAIFRVTERMYGLIYGNIEMAQDTTRLELMKNIITRIWYVVPRGLIAESLGEYSLYIDVPFIFLYDLFGSIASWLIVLSTFKWFAYNVKNYKTISRDSTKLVALWMYPIVFFIFLINNSLIVITFQAIETGILLGILHNECISLSSTSI